MGIRDTLHETWVSLSANKARSFLTILGIVIGIASVIVLTSVAGGIQNMLMEQMGIYQARIIMVNSTQPGLFDDSDIEALRRAFPEIADVSVEVGAYPEFSTAQSDTVSAALIGVNASYSEVYDLDIDVGRNFTAADENRAARVLILGRGLVQSLFGDVDAQPLGEKVRVGPNREQYTVIGVFSGDATTTTYNAAFTPASTLMTRVTGTTGYSNILALIGEDYASNNAETAYNMQTFLNNRKGYQDRDFVIIATAMTEALATLDTYLGAFTILLSLIASISLFVAGVGIMNMMLTNVTERTREIGLRRSLGAHTSDITRQVLSESIALCMIGGILGVIVGYAGSFLAANLVVTLQPQFGFTPLFSIQAVIAAVLACAFIGIAFGIYPARRAARLDPVESLRYQ